MGGWVCGWGEEGKMLAKVEQISKRFFCLSPIKAPLAFGPSNWPKKNGPNSNKHAGLSRIGLSRARPYGSANVCTIPPSDVIEACGGLKAKLQAAEWTGCLEGGKKPSEVWFGRLVATLTERCEQSHCVTQGHRSSLPQLWVCPWPVSVHRSEAIWLGDQGTMYVCCRKGPTLANPFLAHPIFDQSIWMAFNVISCPLLPPPSSLPPPPRRCLACEVYLPLPPHLPPLPRGPWAWRTQDWGSAPPRSPQPTPARPAKTKKSVFVWRRCPHAKWVFLVIRPKPILHFAPFFVHSFSRVWTHYQKWVRSFLSVVALWPPKCQTIIIVRVCVTASAVEGRRVWDTFRSESPPPSLPPTTRKKDRFWHWLPPLPRALTIDLPECQERRRVKKIISVFVKV